MMVLLVSCSARVEGSLRNDSSGELTLEASLEPRMAALIRSLSAIMDSGAKGETPILDGPAIALSMSAAPGIAGVSFHNVSPTAIAGDISISAVNEFLTLTADRGRFITYEGAGPSSEGRLLIALSRSTAPQVLSLISPDVTDYLSALMAPAATGEALSKAEYLFLVSTIYGRPLSDEIAAAKIFITIDFPGPVRSIRGGTYQARRAQFELPLADLLVLEPPLEYEVRWQ
jgi:hypothetical protein